jgi:hypothetical protein
MRQLCVIVAVAAAAIGAAPVAAEPTASTTVLNVPASAAISPGTQTLIQACLGEPVTFVGDSLVVIHRTILPDGSRLVVVHRNPQGAFALGVSSGTVYRIGASDTSVRLTAPPGTFVFTFTANLHVTGPDGSGGFFGQILMHLTVTPEGDVKAETGIVNIYCT